MPDGYGEDGYGETGYGTDRIHKYPEIKRSKSFITTSTTTPEIYRGWGVKDAKVIFDSKSVSAGLGTATEAGIVSFNLPSISADKIVGINRSAINGNYGAILSNPEMKKGDTHPPIRTELFGLTESQFYYSDIEIVVEHKDTNTIVVDEPVDEKNAINDEVVYYWADDGSDLPNIGTYRVEFRVTHPDSRVETFPSESFLEFEVKKKLTA